jgi:hypothetical protein
MSAITFDPRIAMRDLVAAGFTDDQARTIVDVIRESHVDLVSREYLDMRLEALELRLTIKLGTLMLLINSALTGIIIAVLRVAH